MDGELLGVAVLELRTDDRQLNDGLRRARVTAEQETTRMQTSVDRRMTAISLAMQNVSRSADDMAAAFERAAASQSLSADAADKATASYLREAEAVRALTDATDDLARARVAAAAAGGGSGGINARHIYYHSSGDGGGGGAGGAAAAGGLQALLYGRGGRFGAAAPFTLAALGGLGLEHILTTGLAIAGSAAGATAGGGLLALGAGGQMAVGGGSDVAAMKSTLTNVSGVQKAMEKLNNAVTMYGKNSSQAQAAQKALNGQMKLLADSVGPKTAAAEANVAKQTNALSDAWQSASSGAQLQGTKIMDQVLHLGRTYVPLIAQAAAKNLAIINQDLKPLFAWLEGPHGTGIFTHLEDNFKNNLPTAIHAFTQATEFALRLVNVASNYTGGFTKKIDELFTKLNSLSNSQINTFVGKMVHDFDLWEHLVVILGKDIVDLFRNDAGTGNALVLTVTHLLDKLHTYENSSRGKKEIRTIFEVHKQEVLALIHALVPLLKIYGQFYMTVAPPLVKAVTWIATAFGKVVTALDQLGPGGRAMGTTLAGIALLTLKFKAFRGLIGNIGLGLGKLFLNTGPMQRLIGVLSKLPGVGSLFSNIASKLEGTQTVGEMNVGVMKVATDVGGGGGIGGVPVGGGAASEGESWLSRLGKAAGWTFGAAAAVSFGVGAGNWLKSQFPHGLFPTTNPNAQLYHGVHFPSHTAIVGTPAPGPKTIDAWRQYGQQSANAMRLVDSSSKKAIESYKALASEEQKVGHSGEALAASMAAQMIKTHSVTSKGVLQMIDEWKKLPPQARQQAGIAMIEQAKELQSKGELPRGSVAKLMKEMYGSTKAGFDSMLGVTGSDLTKMSDIVDKKIRSMRDAIQAGSSQARKDAETEWARVSNAVYDAMNSGAISTATGAKILQKNTNAILKAFGAKPIPLAAIIATEPRNSYDTTGSGIGHRARGGPVNEPKMYMVGEEAPQHPEVVIATNPAYRKDNLRYWAKAGKMLGVPGFATGGYVYPFPPGTRMGRTDMGVDANMPVGAPIGPIGDAIVKGRVPNWFSGQPMIWWTLTSGPMAGRSVYLGEQITNVAPVGAHVKANQAIARYAASGTGIEMGWGSGGWQTLSQAHGTEGHFPTPEGLAFQAFLAGLSHGKIVGGGFGGMGMTIPTVHAPHVGGSGTVSREVQLAMNKGAAAANAYLQKHLASMAMGSGSFGIPGHLSGSVMRQIYQGLQGIGNKVSIAGVIGNAYRESLLNPASVGSGGGGLWGFTPLGPEQAFAHAHGKPWTDVGVQIAYMLGNGGAKAIRDANSARSPEEAAAIFMNEYERPGIPALAERQSAAARAYAAGYAKGGIVDAAGGQAPFSRLHWQDPWLAHWGKNYWSLYHQYHKLWPMISRQQFGPYMHFLNSVSQKSGLRAALLGMVANQADMARQNSQINSAMDYVFDTSGPAGMQHAGYTPHLMAPRNYVGTHRPQGPGRHPAHWRHPMDSPFSQLPPFGGVFHRGGIVPGLPTEERTIIAKGGETVTDGGMNIYLVVKDGAVDSRKIEAIAERTVNGHARKTAMKVHRGLPSRGGGAVGLAR